MIWTVWDGRDLLSKRTWSSIKQFHSVVVQVSSQVNSFPIFYNVEKRYSSGQGQSIPSQQIWHRSLETDTMERWPFREAEKHNLNLAFPTFLAKSNRTPCQPRNRRSSWILRSAVPSWNTQRKPTTENMTNQCTRCSWEGLTPVADKEPSWSITWAQCELEPPFHFLPPTPPTILGICHTKSVTIPQ